MGAMAGHAIDFHLAFLAQLRPTGLAVRADLAAGIMVDRNPLAGRCVALRNTWAARDHDTARLVTIDHGLAVTTEAEPFGHCGRTAVRAVGVQIRAAHAGGLDLDDDLAFTWSRVGEILQLDLARTNKYCALHVRLLRSVAVSAAIVRLRKSVIEHPRAPVFRVALRGTVAANHNVWPASLARRSIAW